MAANVGKYKAVLRRLLPVLHNWDFPLSKPDCLSRGANPDWDDLYNQYPLTSDFGFPSEHARITGLSIRLNFFINTKNEKY